MAVAGGGVVKRDAARVTTGVIPSASWSVTLTAPVRQSRRRLLAAPRRRSRTDTCPGVNYWISEAGAVGAVGAAGVLPDLIAWKRARVLPIPSAVRGAVVAAAATTLKWIAKCGPIDLGRCVVARLDTQSAPCEERKGVAGLNGRVQAVQAAQAREAHKQAKVKPGAPSSAASAAPCSARNSRRAAGAPDRIIESGALVFSSGLHLSQGGIWQDHNTRVTSSQLNSGPRARGPLTRTTRVFRIRVVTETYMTPLRLIGRDVIIGRLEAGGC